MWPFVVPWRDLQSGSSLLEQMKGTRFGRSYPKGTRGSEAVVIQCAARQLEAGVDAEWHSWSASKSSASKSCGRIELRERSFTGASVRRRHYLARAIWSLEDRSVICAKCSIVLAGFG
jgi:hypothetical protein